MAHKLRKLSSKSVMERYRCTITFCLLFHFVMLLSLVRNTDEFNVLYYHINFCRSNAMDSFKPYNYTRILVVSNNALNDCSSLITEKDHLNSCILGVYVCLCVR